MVENVIPIELAEHRELVRLRTQLERCWCAETSFWPQAWTPEIPSVGQCAVTAAVVFDRFGGEIRRAVNQEVLHYWNLLNGFDVDLTRDQFTRWAPGEVEPIGRDALLTSGPTLAGRHQRLVALLSQ